MRNNYFFENNILFLRTLQYLGGYNRRFYYGDIFRVRNLSTRSRFNILLILFRSLRLRIILVIRLINTIARLFLLRLWLRVAFFILTNHPGSIDFRYLSSFFLFFIIIVIIIFAIRNGYYIITPIYIYISGGSLDKSARVYKIFFLCYI